jgi:hypothetical protein
MCSFRANSRRSAGAAADRANLAGRATVSGGGAKMVAVATTRSWRLDDFLCVTAAGRPHEPAGNFAARLSLMWTAMLREQPEQFERVYAEATEFETLAGPRSARRYLVEPGAVPAVLTRLAAAGIDAEPVDDGDGYSKYEAVAPEWMQIEH